MLQHSFAPVNAPTVTRVNDANARLGSRLGEASTAAGASVVSSSADTNETYGALKTLKPDPQHEITHSQY